MNFDALKHHGYATATGHGSRRHSVHPMYPHPIPPHAMGEFGQITAIPSILSNVGQISSNAASITSSLTGPQMQQTLNRVADDAEMYVYAQIGLQAIATVAAFGVFLIMFHRFVRERK